MRIFQGVQKCVRKESRRSTHSQEREGQVERRTGNNSSGKGEKQEGEEKIRTQAAFAKRRVRSASCCVVWSLLVRCDVGCELSAAARVIRCAIAAQTQWRSVVFLLVNVNGLMEAHGSSVPKFGIISVQVI